MLLWLNVSKSLQSGSQGPPSSGKDRNQKTEYKNDCGGDEGAESYLSLSRFIYTHAGPSKKKKKCNVLPSRCEKQTNKEEKKTVGLTEEIKCFAGCIKQPKNKEE